MKITPLDISDAYCIEPLRHSDERGWFQEWFKYSQLKTEINFDFLPVQANISQSHVGVIRGIHYSIAPRGQAKLVTVLQGSIDDYVVNLNSASAQFGKWQKVELTAENGRSVFLPPHVGHAFQATSPNTTVCYLVTAEFDPDSEKGITPLCSDIGVNWATVDHSLISAKDLAAPTLSEQRRSGLLPISYNC